MTKLRKVFDSVERADIVKKSQQCLWSEAGKPGLDYLLGQRQLSEFILRAFRVGYIPAQDDHQLRGRIILPLFDQSKHLVVVSSRMIDDSANPLPVYWHESYEKSFFLYGAPNAIPYMRKWKFATVCVDGDEEMFDPTIGRFLELRKMSEGDHVLSFDKVTNQNRPGLITKKVSSGIKKCIKISHSNGAVNVTPEHKLFVNGEWKRSDEIKVGDLLLSPLSYSQNCAVCPLSLDECRLLGYMIGDGYCKGSPMFTNTDPGIIADFKEIIERIGDRVDRRDNRHYMIYGTRPRGGYKQIVNQASSRIQQLLKACGVYGQLAYEKSIPPFMFQSSNACILELLNGLFDTDGTVSGCSNQISYSTTSLLLVKQLRMLLLRFGVLSNYRVVVYKNPKHRTGYTLIVTGESAINASKLLSLRSSKKAFRLKNFKSPKRCDLKYPVVDYIRNVCQRRGLTKKQVLKSAEVSLTTLNRSCISYEHIRRINSILKDEFVDVILGGNVFVSQVESVKDGGLRDTYDLTIEQHNNFYAGGALSHNCEGQFDVMQMHNHGIRNAVGLCSHYISTAQFAILQRYCEEVILVLDRDENEAGQKGIKKAMDEMQSYGFDGFLSLPEYRHKLSYIEFPENTDPDNFLRKHGVTALKRMIDTKLRELRKNTYDRQPT